MDSQLKKILFMVPLFIFCLTTGHSQEHQRDSVTDFHKNGFKKKESISERSNYNCFVEYGYTDRSDNIKIKEFSGKILVPDFPNPAGEAKFVFWPGIQNNENYSFDPVVKQPVTGWNWTNKGWGAYSVYGPPYEDSTPITGMESGDIMEFSMVKNDPNDDKAWEISITWTAYGEKNETTSITYYGSFYNDTLYFYYERRDTTDECNYFPEGILLFDVKVIQENGEELPMYWGAGATNSLVTIVPEYSPTKQYGGSSVMLYPKLTSCYNN